MTTRIDGRMTTEMRRARANVEFDRISVPPTNEVGSVPRTGDRPSLTRRRTRTRLLHPRDEVTGERTAAHSSGRNGVLKVELRIIAKAHQHFKRFLRLPQPALSNPQRSSNDCGGAIEHVQRGDFLWRLRPWFARTTVLWTCRPAIADAMKMFANAFGTPVRGGAPRKLYSWRRIEQRREYRIARC